MIVLNETNSTLKSSENSGKTTSVAVRSTCEPALMSGSSASEVEDGSEENHEDSKASPNKDTSKKSDSFNVVSVTCFVVVTVYWLFAASTLDGFGSIVQNAAVALAACFATVEVVSVCFPSLERLYVTMHFGLGLCQNALYIASFAVDISFFQKIWTSAYFGYYLWTMIVIVSRSSEFFRMFRVFYTVHHTISFIITGSWLLVSPCCPQETYLLRGIMIWLSSDIWIYFLNVTRSIRPDIDVATIRRAQLVIFFIERVHRFSAYIQAFVITKGNLNELDWVVFGTGFFNDMVDAAFQAHSLKQFFGRDRAKNRSKIQQQPMEKEDKGDIESNKPPALSMGVRSSSIFRMFIDPPSNSAPSRVQWCNLSPGPFNPPASNLEDLLTLPEFDKVAQWELPAVKFQELTQDRLMHLANSGSFRISQGPGMSPQGVENSPPGSFMRLLEAFHFVGMYDLSLFDVVGVHAIGGNVVFIHGSDEQLLQHRERIDSINDVYCFGGTELAHGSNLKQIQTVANFDPDMDGFVLETPSATGCKYWIGNSTFVADYVVVLCRIFVRGEEQGFGWLRVPLWQEDEEGAKSRYPGVDVRDTGNKAGCNGIGNGCIRFDKVRLSRDALLSRFCKVDESGSFRSDLSAGDLFLRCIQTFVLERIGVATAAIGSAKVALFVAMKYAGARHQFGPDGVVEVPLISYPMHRRRLLSHASRLFVAKALVDRIGESAEATFRPYELDANRKALHALSCMAKAFGCWEAFAAAQEARECCGGHAFAAVSQIGMIRNDLDVTLTFAGDNSLLALEVVRFRLKQVKEWPLVKQLKGPARPLFWSISLTDSNHPAKLMQKVAKALVFREESMLLMVGKKMRGSEEGRFDRFTRNSYDMREVASAVYDRMCVTTWLERHLASRSVLLDEIGMLDAMLRIEKRASWYMAQGLMSASTLKSIEGIISILCDRLGEKYEEVMSALCVPAKLVENWPLVHDDYCQRMRDLTYPCPVDTRES